MSGQTRRLVVLDDYAGIYRLVSDRGERTLYIDARVGASLAVTCECDPADECVLFGQWCSLLAPVLPIPRGGMRIGNRGWLKRGYPHLFLIADSRSEHMSGTWLLHHATDIARVKESDLPRALPYIGGAQ